MKLFQVENHLESKPKNTERILSGEQCNVLNVQLRKGESIPEHNAPKEVVVVCRKGVVKFPVEGKEQILKENSVLLIAPEEMHSLEAVEDSELVIIKIK